MPEQRDLRAEEREPSRDELRAMAYADGELSAAERREFELQLAERPDLRREVSRLRRLEVLARQAAGPEPMDHEWRTLACDPVQRVGIGLGWTLLGGGALVLAAVGLWELWTSGAALVVKGAASAVLLGLALLLGATLRARLRTRAHDPYTEVQR